ncbi:MAG TPA: outer-membrane lipoprotein carrier protein LolA [Pyrinomonadaceae bacterium]|nr:outer-membrane lipoprotein carrier protein LolA [Pyrinomonadaceae bacterium]
MKKIEKRLRATKTLSANLELRKYNPQLDESDIYSGKMDFAAGKSRTDFSTLIRWIKPADEMLWVANGEYTLYRPLVKQAFVGNVNKFISNPKIQNQFIILSKSIAELKQNYTASIVKEKEKTKDGIKTTHLMFEPKIADVFKSYEIWVDKKGTPIQIKINEKNNDTTTIYLTEIKRNKKIDSKIFQKNLPKGTKIIGAEETNFQGSAVLNEILKRLDAHNKVLTSVKANIKVDKYNSQLGEHDIFEGNVMYLPGTQNNMYIRIDFTKPNQEQLAVIKNDYALYRPQLKQVIIGKVDLAKGNAKANNALAFMSMKKAELKANYNITYIGQENVGITPTWHLKIVPSIAGHYKQADLWVDANGMPIQATVTEKNNDTTTVLLTNIEKNKIIDAKEFMITPPKGTKIIKS